MADSDMTAKQAQGKRSYAWLGVLVPFLLILGAAGGFLLFQPDKEKQDKDKEPPKPLALDRDYYVIVKTIEFFPTRPDSKAWDRDSGPDIDFELDWQGNTVFEAKTKSDTLIGSWDALSLDLKDAILNQRVDLSSSIDAAIIRVEKDTTVTLTVWDSDVAGNDQAGAVQLNLDQFQLGDNVTTFEQTPKNAIKRIVVRVIDKTLPVKELVEEATRP